MISPELLIELITRLEASGLPYMLTGSIAANVHGHPRTTHDVNVILEAEPRDLAAIVAAFPQPDYFYQEHVVREALAMGAMFNALDEARVGKIDFWVLNDDVLNQRAFWRKIRRPLLGIETWVPRPEDLILLKLRWMQRSGGSEKQMNDCIELLKFNAPEINLAETDHWSMRVGVSKEWGMLRQAANI
jgi:hypothetical protein